MIKKSTNEIKVQHIPKIGASILSYLRRRIGAKKYMGNEEKI